MPRYYISESNFEPSSVTKYQTILNWFEQTLNSDYHIFIEFKIPSGREIDFLILAKHGAWLIEHKQHNFVAIYENKNWEYLDFRRRRRTQIKIIRNQYENPYKQATNSGDSFSNWLFENRHLAGDLNRRLKTFPCVAFPESEDIIEHFEKDIWCYLSKGIKGIKENINIRSWNRNDWISEETVLKIAENLGLIEISYSDLIYHKSNLEKIFRETGENQIGEVKKILSETNQLLPSNDWIYSLNLQRDEESRKVINVKDISNSSLPFILSGNFGSGKTIACYQIMETLIKDNLGFIVSLRDLLTSNINENEYEVTFKGQNLIFPINIIQDTLQNVEDEIKRIFQFLIYSLIKIYNKDGLLEQISHGISNYLSNRRFFIIIDGWDELQGGSLSLAKKLVDYILLNDIPVIISCRRPLDNYLKKIEVDKTKIPIYSPLPPSMEQIKYYMKERLIIWSEAFSIEELLKILTETFGSNITPFHLYATTIVPIAEPPKNSAQLLRWMIIAQIGWELIKTRKDYIKEIKSFKDLIQILEKEETVISGSKTSIFSRIFDSYTTDDSIFPNGSIQGILSRISIAEVEGTNNEISLDKLIKINPLIIPFVERMYHPEGLYVYPRMKTKLLQDYFLAEYALEELITTNKIIPLITIDVYLLFHQLLEIDNRWRKTLKSQGKETDITELVVSYLTQYPVKLRPTVQDPDFDLIDGGMRMIQSRARLGVPSWYTNLLSACIIKVRNAITLSPISLAKDSIIDAFLQLQKMIPEITSDTIYDGYIKDHEYGHISQSKEPGDYTKLIMSIFPEYLEKTSNVMEKINEYCKELNQKQKKESENNKEDEEFYNYRIDNYICEEDIKKELLLLFSILEYSGSKNLRSWTQMVLVNIPISGHLIEYLLTKKIPSTVISGLLMRYEKEISDWVDQALGVQMPGEWEFDEECIFNSFFKSIIREAPKELLAHHWHLLLKYSSDLNLFKFLIDNSELFNIETLRILYNISLTNNSNPVNFRLKQLIQNCNRFQPSNMLLSSKNAITLIDKGYPLTQDEFQWLLTDNRDKIIQAEIEAKSPEKFIPQDETEDKNEKSRRTMLQMAIKNRPTWEFRERFKIYKAALIHGLDCDEKDLASTIKEFAQIKCILKLFGLKDYNPKNRLEKKLIELLSPKTLAFKLLLEGKSIYPVLIAFYRLITEKECSVTINEDQNILKDVDEWFRRSELLDGSYSSGYIPLNDDMER